MNCYNRGVPCDREMRAVMPEEAETFMRGLVQPSPTTCYQLVDESDDT